MNEHIKLVASDIDGTVIKPMTGVMYPEMLREIERITSMGIRFVASSGRQYACLKKLFKDCKAPIDYICENGSLVAMDGEIIKVLGMDKNRSIDLVNNLREYVGKGYNIMVSTPSAIRVETRDEGFIHLLRDQIGNDIVLVDDVLDTDEEYIKISIYHEGTIRKLGDEVLIPKWKDVFQSTFGGNDWVDFMGYGVDKGNALLFLQNKLGITKDETMAFGDNSNDIGMLQASSESYAVDTAVDELKAYAKHICEGYEGKGVYKVLNKFF